jgi:pimeloyl-ACP methyl ester carboxylesterase
MKTWAFPSLAVAILVLVLGYIGYARDLERAAQRIATGSEVAQTACGPIEYAVQGEGRPVLLVHGAGGGFDQGLEIAASLAGSGFRVVTMSRFGYLRTPLPRDASPQAQADAHACLLDALRIEQAAIAGVSAGAPSAMQFALRHPTRADALVLLVPLAYAARSEPPAPPGTVARFMYERAIRSDLLYWLAMRVAPDLVVKTILATPPSMLMHASSEEKERVAQMMERILPLSRRQAGLLNDSRIAQALPRYELERISARTLVISVEDDLYGTFESARYTAAHIPRAYFVGYPSGGHVWVGHHRRILAELEVFLSGRDPALARQ